MLWRRTNMLAYHFIVCSFKGPYTTKPFVNYHCQSILITGWTWMCLNLFRSHIGNSTSDILCLHRVRTACQGCNAKVREHYFTTPPQEHVFRLHITVNYLLIMGILQSFGHLI